MWFCCSVRIVSSIIGVGFIRRRRDYIPAKVILFERNKDDGRFLSPFGLLLDKIFAIESLSTKFSNGEMKSTQNSTKSIQLEYWTKQRHPFDIHFSNCIDFVLFCLLF